MKNSKQEYDRTKMIILDGTQEELVLQAVMRIGIDIRSYIIQKSQGEKIENIEIFLDRVSCNIDRIITSHNRELVNNMFNRIQEDNKRIQENGN